jgi:hypothetical protein
MSNTEYTSRIDGTTQTLDERLRQRAAAAYSLGKRSVAAVIAPVADAIERHRPSIALSVGLVTATAGLGLVGVAGVSAAKAEASELSDKAYVAMMPSHLLEAERGRELESGRVTLVSDTGRESSDHTGTAAAGLMLLAAGSNVGLRGLRGAAVRRRNDEPEWLLDLDLGQPADEPQAEHRPRSVDALVLDDMFEGAYQPPAFERFDNWCGKVGVAAVRGIAQGVRRGVAAFNAWQEDMAVRREEQLAISATTYNAFDVGACAGDLPPLRG